MVQSRIHTEDILGNLNKFAMKKAFILSLLLLPVLVWGQVINHFEQADSKWHVARTYPAGNMQNPSFAATTTAVYGYQGDTLISGLLWKKIYSTSDPLFQSNLVFEGLTRTQNNQVFYLDTLFQLSNLYNFDLNVGDQWLFNLYGNNPVLIPVIQVDSIQLNGVFYKRITFDEPSGVNFFDYLDEQWIEGIGSKHGPLFPAFPRKFSGEMADSMLLTCSYSDSQSVWQHPSYSDCYVNIVLGLNDSNLSDVNIYPNPFSAQITVENPENTPYSLNLLSSSGQVIIREPAATGTHTFQFGHLETGIYFLQLANGEGTKIVKLVKQE